jgi:hypothetical protein
MERNSKQVRTLEISDVQYECLFSDEHYRFKIITKGRRFGLTKGMAHYIIYKMVSANQSGKPIDVLWGDVTYDNIRKYVERMFLPILRKNYGFKDGKEFTYNISAKTLKIGRSVCDFRSAEKPQTWEGYGYHLIFLNEAGIILHDDDYLYKNAVLPMMIDYPESKLIAGGVPKGKKGVFWELWQRCEQGEEGYKGYNYSSYDNVFVEPEMIKEVEMSMSDVIAQQEIYGQFVDNISNPFAYAFSREKHVKPCAYDPSLPVLLSFDFNVEPITCIAGQELPNEVRIIKEYRLMNSNIHELCRRIRSDFRNINGVTGDATGYARSAISDGNINYYVIIEKELGISRQLIRTPIINDSHANSRALVNFVLTHHKKFFIDPSCKYLIEDLLYVEADNGGKINKNKDKHQSHLLDCFRYYIATYHRDALKKNSWIYENS